MNRLRTAFLSTALLLVIGGCASYSAYQHAKSAEELKNWDEAVVQYQKALDIDPGNLRFKVALMRAKLEASRVHFEKGKTLEAAAMTEKGPGQYRLAQLAATELELTVKLDPTNQWAAVEYGKVAALMQQITRVADQNSIEERKKRMEGAKAQPPVLNPASDQPISLSFPHETPVKDIYRALGNAFGINIMFDQAVKNDPIAIELKDVTAEQALERVMQAAGHFYKVLDEHTIIIIPDNPQARRDYEDLVIRTFYLSNGDAEQVTNVVRTMLEARNVFPLKALNAITIRDTADKVRIAEKIIEANDKAKAEVVVDVELLQLDAGREQDIGAYLAGTSGALTAVPSPTTSTTTTGTGTTTSTATTTTPALVTLDTIRKLTRGNWTFTLPTVQYGFIKNLAEAQTLANPELRISEGEKATLHIGSRVPVPIASFQAIGGTTNAGAFTPTVSFQYQDIGIKVAVEPRVHHNREVTLKLTVEVSDLGPKSNIGGQDLPTFVTRTIEDTIRLKDGETNFLAGLIQTSDTNADNKTPFLGDIPFFGRFFTENQHHTTRTDLMLTMTPHIVRIPDITEEDMAPMWVGTQNNLTFRGVSPRLESRADTTPFTATTQQTINGIDVASGLPVADGEPGNVIQPPAPAQRFKPRPVPVQPVNPNPESAPNPKSQSSLEAPPLDKIAATSADGPQGAADSITPTVAPRIAAEPFKMSFKPGEEKAWTLVGMDLDGLTTKQIVLHYNPQALDITDVSVGEAVVVADKSKPPVINVDPASGTVRISSSDGQPLQFTGGGDIAAIRARGGLTGDSYLVIETPAFKNARGEGVAASVSGGHAIVE